MGHIIIMFVMFCYFYRLIQHVGVRTILNIVKVGNLEVHVCRNAPSKTNCCESLIFD